MNKLAVITAFLGGVKNRYITYKQDRTLAEKFALAAQIERLDGFELCYPADFQDVGLLKSLLADYGFGVSSVNVWPAPSFISKAAAPDAGTMLSVSMSVVVTSSGGSERSGEGWYRTQSARVGRLSRVKSSIAVTW